MNSERCLCCDDCLSTSVVSDVQLRSTSLCCSSTISPVFLYNDHALLVHEARSSATCHVSRHRQAMITFCLFSWYNTSSILIQHLFSEAWVHFSAYAANVQISLKTLVPNRFYSTGTLACKNFYNQILCYN